jgi:hypothetical protein
VILALIFLELARLAAVLLAPVVAGCAVWVGQSAAQGRLANWIGLTIGFELMAAVAIDAFVVGTFGPSWFPPYRFATLFGVVSFGLGVLVVRAHWRRLRGRAVATTYLALMCLALGLAVAIALVPWILGAPMPLGGGEFSAEYPIAGDVSTYLWTVGPVVLGMELEAWLLLSPERPHPVAAALAVALALLVAGVALLLPGTRWDARHHAKLERRTQRLRAEELDHVRRRSLAEVLGGQEPRLLGEPCPVSRGLRELEKWEQYLDAPTDWATIARYEGQWSYQQAVDFWTPGATSEGFRRRYHADGTSEVAAWRPGESLEGPRRHALLAQLDEDRWIGPLSGHDFLMTPDMARKKVRDAIVPASWTLDGTLVIAQESQPVGRGDTTELGEISAKVWLWDYARQSFVCAGESHIQRSIIGMHFEDYQLPRLRDAVRMRALAHALAASWSVEASP